MSEPTPAPRSTARISRVYGVSSRKVRGVASQPRDWCVPRESFGRLDVADRVWQPPDPERDPVAVSKFRAAVMQNVIVLQVREFKNLKGIPQEALARRDQRADSLKMWNARLCGRANLTTQDMATLMMLLPGMLPAEETLRVFIDVAEGTVARPEFWSFPDSSRRRPGA